MSLFSFYSPAKINLFFKIVGGRKDGYHEIVSLCQTVNIFDEITIELASTESSFSSNDQSLLALPDNKNLVLRAVHLLEQFLDFSFPPLKICLLKKIPIGAGLGGGSGNAATILWALNKLFELNLTVTTLSKLGAELGADVPLFFGTGTVLCEGTGATVSSIPFRTRKKPLWLAIPNPMVFSSTPAVYGALRIGDMDIALERAEALVERSLREDVEENDLEGAAFSLYPSLAAIKEKLLQNGFDLVAMSGSGSAFYCLGSPLTLSLPSLDLIRINPITRSLNDWYYP